MRPDWLNRRLLAALALGAASVLAYAPFGFFPAAWLALGGFFRLLERAAGWRAGGRLGFAFGLGAFGAGVSWVYVSLSVFGGLPAPAAVLATLAFCAVLALFPALAGALWARLAPAGRWRGAILFAALWALAEWLRGWVLTGFPWLAVGYSQTPPSPLAGYAPLLGVYGVSLATALLAAGLAQAVSSRQGRRFPLLGAALLLAGGALLTGVEWTRPQGEAISVALLQGNVPQELKWRPERFYDSLFAYQRLVSDHPARLTVLPETALPAFYDQIPPAYLDELRQLARRGQGDLLLGIAVGEGERYFNGAVSLGTAPPQRYAKSHLVPFGEFVPPGFAWFIALLRIPMSDFTSGGAAQPPLDIAGQKVAVNICYEDAFGEELIRALPAATVLVNLSNVAWFGDSLAPAQHLQIAQLRALETGRMMLRATNTGMTAIVGADGRVVSALPPFTRGALTGDVRGYAGSTPYVRFGNAAMLALAALLIALASLPFAKPDTAPATV